MGKGNTTKEEMKQSARRMKGNKEGKPTAEEEEGNESTRNGYSEHTKNRYSLYYNSKCLLAMRNSTLVWICIQVCTVVFHYIETFYAELNKFTVCVK